MDLPNTPYIDISANKIDEATFGPNDDSHITAESSNFDAGVSKKPVLRPRDNHVNLSGSFQGSYGWADRCFWYCCECGDGPHSSSIEVACCVCEHKVCDACNVDFA